MRGRQTVSALACLVSLLMTVPAWALDRMNWSPRNHDALEKLIKQVGIGSPGYSDRRPPYAVFDWDQTSAFLDCQDVTLRYQVSRLAFRLRPDDLAPLLRDEVNGVRQVTIEGRPTALADLNADILAAFRELYRLRTADPTPEGLASVRQTPVYRDFATKLPLLYEAYCTTPGIGAAYGYPWVTYLLAGFTPDEVRNLARAAIEDSLGAAIENVTWHGPADFGSRCGPFDFTFRSGLRVQPEMQNLMASLRAAGIEVYIVSASLKQVVEVFAGLGQFGYNVPADHVIAMETDSRDGRLLPRYKPGWVPTFGPGKVTAIRQVLGKLGEPVLGAGDSDGDYEMLTAFAGMKLAVVFNRLKGGPIGTLCDKAVADTRTPAPRFLLQGRNENTGLLIPGMETIGFGKSAPKLLK